MALRFVHLHAAKSADALNEEFLVLENTGPLDFVSKGCALTVSKATQPRGRPVGTIDPGFTLHAGEKICLVSGNPAKKGHGAPPAEKEGCKNYHLFLVDPILADAGATVRLLLNQVEVAKATFDPKDKHGLGQSSA